MAQSGYTPISLYFSATGAAVPSAGNLVAGELALNTNDGKLYFKNSSGVVTLLAGSTSGPAGGSTTQVQYNNAGVLAGITGATSNGTALTLVAPNLGSPNSVGTMPAFTLGGTVSGGGNQINNVVIGTTTPLAGAFTTLSATGTSTLAAVNASGEIRRSLSSDTVYSASTLNADHGLSVYNGSVTANSYASIEFINRASGTSQAGISSVTPSATNSALAFQVMTANVVSEPMRLSGTGLAVTGTLSATGTLSGGTSGTAYSFSGSAPATSLTLNSSGDLGVGVTPSGTTRLQVKSVGNNLATFQDANANGVLYAVQTDGVGQIKHIATWANSGINTYHAWYVTTSAGSQPQAMTLDSSGNLGIGTSSPSSFTTGGTPILVVGNNAQTQITLYGGSSTGDINFATSNSGAGLYKGVVRYDGTSNFMSFWTNSAEKMRLDSSGRLGIGTTSPQNPLQVKSTTRPQLSVSYDGITGLYLEDSSNSVGKSWKLATSSAVNSQLEFYQSTATSGVPTWAASAAMTLDANGTLIVGSTSAMATSASTRGQVSANGSSDSVFVLGVGGTATSRIYTTSSSTTVGTYTNTPLILDTNSTERARIDSSGSLQLKKASNETEATAQFYISGSGYEAYHWLDSTAYYIGQNSSIRSLRIYSNSYTAGVNLASGGTSWGTFSDERLKYDIEPITNGLDKLNSIRCVSYRLKDVDASDSQKKLGVIAQDLVGVVDEVIDITKRHGDETDYMSVRYTELIPVLIKSIQEQQTLITQLTARITALETA